MVSAGIKYRVLIVDDHPIVRHGLIQLIDAEPDLEVCGEAQSDREARAALLELDPDVMIVDVSLAQGDGIDLVREVRAQRSDLPMLVLSMHDETIYAERMLAAGANGYIMKEAAYEQLLTALRRVLDGGRYLSEAMEKLVNAKQDGAALSGAIDPIGRLSNRELQVLSLLGRGMSSRQAAESLHVSVKTVESHRQSLKRKLNLATNAQLLQYSVQWFASRANAAVSEPPLPG